MSFELKDQSGLLGVTALAGRLGVTDQTVYNYEARGMSPDDTGPGGEKLWDPARAAAWVRENGPSSVRGGKRRGAGAKPARESIDVEESESTQITLREVFLEAERELVARGMSPEDARAAGEVAALMQAVKNGDLTLHQIETVQQGLKAVRELLTVREKEGKLVDRAEMQVQMGQHLVVVRRTLEAFPGRAAAELAAELKLPAESVPEIKRLLRDKLGAVMRQLAEDPFGENTAG
ncbi:MAG: hypothetical protein JSS51_03490 [Planctomycetes bacterium]|nr:hypothetical protein [Planctomycetota bacterium]